MKEYLEGRNLITKLQAKHDLLQKTLGESECVSPALLSARLLHLLLMLLHLLHCSALGTDLCFMNSL